ncbi:class I SAM-dependent methyltransferase [Actinomadura bangladeshensis]|uniref:class I SAM-dependent methyltransferase n=1 Tax=Actinomadura bangladeshensis TaxID=453573 RepID=UPI001FB5B717|nr:class I SAM-dependent methyltransferase [Actinomadura bangladeshensis]
MTDLRTPPVSDGDLFSERARQYALEKPLQRIHILEAGCGWGTGLDLGDREHHVTGVDLESPELRAYTCERPDLDTWHLGDLRTVPLPPRAFDIVHAAYLIERVPHAELVLDRFVAALKPGGLLLVHLRDRNTAFGFLDRTLPRWLRTSGRNRRPRSATGPRAGRGPRGAHARVPYPGDERIAGPGAGAGAAPAPPEQAAPPPEPRSEPASRPVPVVRTSPPPAVYSRVASRSGMRWYCVMRGLVVAEEYTSRQAIDALGAGTGLADLLCRLVSAATRGRLTADHSEITLVIRKPENRFARVI